MFMIIAGLLATATIGAIVVFTIVRSIRKEQRGFDVKPAPPPSKEGQENR
jgi:hypothetical protein